MMNRLKTIQIVASVIIVSLAASPHAQPLPDVQGRAIAALNEDLLYPEKAKIRGLASALATDGTWTTCGYVFPMGSNGVPDRQWTFMVKVQRDDTASVSIANDDMGFWAVLDVCRNRGVTILTPEQVSGIPPKLISPNN